MYPFAGVEGFHQVSVVGIDVDRYDPELAGDPTLERPHESHLNVPEHTSPVEAPPWWTRALRGVTPEL